MSGKPSKENVSALRDRLTALRETDLSCVALERALKDAQAGLVALELKRSQEQAEVQKMLTEMDCVSSGNYGFLGRMTWMLTELNAQARR